MHIKNVPDQPRPRALQNPKTKRWHIQYENRFQEDVISKLSWLTKEGAEQIINNILNKPYEVKYIL